ncbi:MAG: amidophosphoribosyltransferase, partial [Planctomycetota bacterium]
MNCHGLKHHCGLFGIVGPPDAVELTHLGLYAQQHRGQESAGICTTDGHRILRRAGSGLVTQVFDAESLQALRNPTAVGHVRYSTAGLSCEANAQPLLFECAAGPVAIAHNGNLTNAAELRRRFEAQGHIFQTTSDTEVVVHLLASPEFRENGGSLPKLLDHLEGAYCLLLLFRDRLVAIRDPLGFRPLSLGRVANGAVVVASETCALDIVDAEYVRDIEPGEIVTITEEGMHSERFGPPGRRRGAACIFEQIYFADPSSDVFGDNVHLVRVALGRKLAEEAPADGDMAAAVPNCARCAAEGYAQASGIPLGRAFTTNFYVGRSFILPSQDRRDLVVKMKLNVIKAAVRGKRLVVVEDSVVRGTTTRGKMSALRKAGVEEIHLRVASPPIRHPCYFGIDFPDPSKLVATGRNVEEICRFLEVDSLQYLSVEGMLSCVRMPRSQYCTACFTADYP